MAIVHILIAKTQDWPAGGNLYKTESQCPGPKVRNQDPRMTAEGNHFNIESHYPGPKI